MKQLFQFTLTNIILYIWWIKTVEHLEFKIGCTDQFYKAMWELEKAIETNNPPDLFDIREIHGRLCDATNYFEVKIK